MSSPHCEQNFPDAGEWLVLRTRSRQEKPLAWELGARGIPHFLPLVTATKCYAGRPVVIEQPLCPGHLFLRGPLEALRAADRAERVAEALAVEQQAALDHALRNIHLALARGARLDPHPALRNGVRAVVRDGPFRGLRGMIDGRGQGPRNRLILQVEMLGRAASLEIEASLLEPSR